MIDTLQIEPAPLSVIKEWVTRRHYAHTMPIVTHAFALIQDDAINGVCTFGPPPRNFNDSFGLFDGRLAIPCFELNRLVIGDGYPPNALSWFVSRALGLLPAPATVVSYADPNHGHHGYIYQATNWLYLGVTSDTTAYEDADGNRMHARTVVSQNGTRQKDQLPAGLQRVEQLGKHRYLQFLGTKADRRNMRRHLVYQVLDYPKGPNHRYMTPVVGRQGRLEFQ